MNMAKKESKTKVRDLPKETQLEIQRAAAKIAQAKVDKGDAQATIDKHRAEIDRLKKE